MTTNMLIVDVDNETSLFWTDETFFLNQLSVSFSRDGSFEYSMKRNCVSKKTEKSRKRKKKHSRRQNLNIDGFKISIE